MPIIDVKRQGVRPAVRKVPTSTCAVTMPMTLDRVNKEVRSENEEPQVVESLQDAFEKFKPQECEMRMARSLICGMIWRI
jgi:hypothetical protein